jgi:hypothetical protein
LNIYITHILLVLSETALLYLVFTKGYLRQKGRNLADKQDIADITRKVEEVKIEFSQKNEQLKTNLQFILSNQLQYFNEERIALIAFYETISQWINEGIIGIRISSLVKKNVEEANIIQNRLSEFYSKSTVNLYKVELFTENDSLKELSHDLHICCTEINSWALYILIDIERTYVEEDRINNEIEYIRKTEPDNTTKLDSLLESIDKNIKTRGEHIEKYNKELIVQNKKFNNQVHEYIPKVREYLKEKNQIK